jgi:hypothetical protein
MMNNLSKSQKNKVLEKKLKQPQKASRVEEPHNLGELMDEQQMSKFLDLLLKKKL